MYGKEVLFELSNPSEREDEREKMVSGGKSKAAQFPWHAGRYVPMFPDTHLHLFHHLTPSSDSLLTTWSLDIFRLSMTEENTGYG
jgi:hypothetical protein